MNRPTSIRTLTPQGLSIPAQLRELIQRHELIWNLVLKDVRIRYKQTLIGVVWAIIQPVMTMIVFTLFFGKLANVPSDELPYPIFYFTALLPWTYFSNAVNAGAGSVVNNQNMVKKVYFPRLALPLSAVMVGLVDLAIASTILLILLPVYDIEFRATMFVAPLFVGFAVYCAFTVSLWLSILNAKYRDVKHALPFLMQLWMFLSPVAYGSSLVPERWQTVYALNPLTTIINGFRWSITGAGTFNPNNLLISLGLVTMALLAGMVYFRRNASDIADIV